MSRAREPELEGFSDASVYTDGTMVKGPKAVCELQGYVYAAWLRTVKIYDVLDDVARATALRTKVDALFAWFNEAFRDEETGFYAFALDGEKKKVLSVACDSGHCLWSVIVPLEHAGRVVARLVKSDMWSRWGIRTRSASHPAYNLFPARKRRSCRMTTVSSPRIQVQRLCRGSGTNRA